MERVREITVAEASAMLAAAEPATWLDVRESWEIEIASLPGTLALTEELVGDLLESADREAPFVFLCHHGIRSVGAAAFFRDRGFTNVCSVTGGIDAWSREIDDTVPRY